MSRERVDGDGPKCRCGRPAVWSGFCEMADGKGWCSAALLPQPASESPEAEPVVTRAHREQASVTLQDAGAATLRWIASGRVPLKAPFNDDLRRVALALATAEHNAKRESADYTAKLEDRVVKLCELIDSLHFAIGKREPHGTPEMTVACVLDWIRDVKNPVEPLL